MVTIEDGQIVGREQREKVAHGRGHDHGGHVHLEGEARGFDAGAQATHNRMAAPIADCQVLLARGMGSGAYASLLQAGIRPILTAIADIDEAALQAANGTIMHHQERLH